jgi:Phytanoyl-CoA dioxygenase (PhyH)
MLSNEQLKGAVKKLLAQSVIPENEVNDLFRKAVDYDYWRTLCPELGVMSQLDLEKLQGAPLSSEQAAWACAHLERHGYFQIPEIIAPAVVARMYKCVELLRSAGWPPVFSFVYDEFWAISRTPSLVNFLSRKLGTGYVQAAGVWTYRVDPKVRASGWSPHVDSRNDEERITLWIPLTDATIGNGCMYVIPQDRIPPAFPASYLDWTAVSRDELGILLRNVTPLPAAAGSVLGWNNSLIHWGGRALESTTFPRISIGVEFMAKRAKPRSWETPVFDLQLPDFATRIRAIGRSILYYEEFETAMRKYCGLATNLVEWKN